MHNNNTEKLFFFQIPYFIRIIKYTDNRNYTLKNKFLYLN